MGEKKTVRESRTRHEKIKQALANKPTAPYFNTYGMTPQKIREALTPRQSRPPAPKRVKQKIKRQRPAKQVPRRKSHSLDPKMLLTIPNTGSRLTIEYPTPSWFKPTEKADVSVIVPVFKSDEVVKGLIRSWDLENDGLKVELIFVDDECPQNSKDAIIKCWTNRKLELEGKSVGRVYYNSVNLGFGITCNAGADNATGDYLIFLNADTLVTKGWIKPIIDLFADPAVGIVGNLQIKKGGMWDGTIDSAGSEWSWNAMSFLHIGRHTYNHKELSKPFHPHKAPKDIFEIGEREMVTGCCIGIRKDLFTQIGGFNPNYRIGYWEDSELCLTVREKGYKVMYQPHSKIYHILSHTKSGPHKFHDYNRNFFFNKWLNTGRIDPLISSKRNRVPEVKTILINRRESNGDVLLAAAVAPALKKRYPGCSIYFSTQCKEVLEGNPFIDRIIEDKDVSERLFQVYYNLDMIYEQRPYTHILDAYADAVGVKREDCMLHLSTTSFKKLPEKYVVVHAGCTSWVGRDWRPGWFDSIARRLKAEGYFVVCVGRRDHLVPCDADMRDKTTIHELASIIKNAQFFVGIDSFPMHVAQTFNIPSVCFFGSIDPKLRLVSDNVKAVVAENLPCLGCHHRKPGPSIVTNTCETGTLDCVEKVSVDMMWKVVKEQLNVHNVYNVPVVSNRGVLNDPEECPDKLVPLRPHARDIRYGKGTRSKRNL